MALQLQYMYAQLRFHTIINVNMLDHKYTVPWPGNLMDSCQDL